MIVSASTAGSGIDGDRAVEPEQLGVADDRAEGVDDVVPDPRREVAEVDEPFEGLRRIVARHDVTRRRRPLEIAGPYAGSAVVDGPADRVSG